jgi:glutamate synthase domain-containing protein 3
MRMVDLSQTTLRELNAALHRLTPDTNERYWRVLNPRGQHAIAAGLDAPATIEIEGHVGYYCAGMNKEATIVVNGSAGQGVAENMMSGRVHVKGDASQAAGAIGALRHLDERHRYRRKGIGGAYVRLHGTGGQSGRARRCG